jgi:fructokinase
VDNSMPVRPVIVAIGEILWDMFPEGPQFGGAPANFASSVAELGGDGVEVHVVSAVGRDELGKRAIELLRERGVSTDFVAEIDRPTGQVLVHLDRDGQASYEFASNTAWDSIEWSDELNELAARADAVCFGTLAQRSDISRQTTQRFVRATRPECRRVLDVNLRPPFWSREVVLQSLELANVLKLNDGELAVLADLIGFDKDLELAWFRKAYSLSTIAVTRGEHGSLVFEATGMRSDLPGQPVNVVNTVGAGDSYTAALVIGILRGLPLNVTNAWASRVAAFVCTQPGAAPELAAHLRNWTQ